MGRFDYPEPDFPPPLDFRKITPESKKLLTTILLVADGKRHKWITAGACSLSQRGRDETSRWWSLEAKIPGAYDFEHSSAYAFTIPLVGLEIGSLALNYGRSSFVGWVRSDYISPEYFRVPNEKYDPRKLKLATKCKERGCEPHVFVPEGHYLPPRNDELFNRIRGFGVEIVTGIASSEQEVDEE